MRTNMPQINVYKIPLPEALQEYHCRNCLEPITFSRHGEAQHSYIHSNIIRPEQVQLSNFCMKDIHTTGNLPSRVFPCRNRCGTQVLWIKTNITDSNDVNLEKAILVEADPKVRNFSLLKDHACKPMSLDFNYSMSMIDLWNLS